MTQTTDQERVEPIKMQPGDDLHLTMLMAPHGLNFVTGKDREQLLAWGRDVWQASRRAQGVPYELRNAAQRAHDWMERQAKAQGKGGHATFDLMMLREERDALAAALAA